METPMIRSLLAAGAFALASSSVLAQVTVTEPWIRATVAGQKVAGGYLQIRSSRDTALVEARTGASATTEVHEMSMVDNVMKMRAVPRIDIPAGRTVELKPGGYHLMLIDIREPMTVGRKVPITLVFEDRDGKRESVEVTAEVRTLGGAAGAAKKDEHKHHH